jgi:hypothetical protein
MVDEIILIFKLLCTRAVMGSVSNYLIRNCPCPVTVCKLTSEEIDARKELNVKKQATFNDVLSKSLRFSPNDI